MTASSTRPPRPATRPSPTPTTWPLLHAIWTAETAPARDQHYRDLLQAALPPGHRAEPGHQARWLWRTLHAAELAGLDPARVLADAIAERDLAGARDIPSVIDARLRHRLGSLVPLPSRPWSAQVPAIADPERRAFVTEIAALMDARKDRLGEHAAEHALPWAVNALGPVPGHPLDRLDWQRRASSIGAYRELSGYDDPAEPIGPEPTAAAPDKRAAWYEALAALGPVDGPDVRGMPDGTLLHLRDTYPTETAWAPPWVGDELRQVRAGARDASLAAARAGAEAAAAERSGRDEAAARHRVLAASYRALHDAYRERESRVRRRHGRPGRLGNRHPRPAPPRRRRRRRTAPPASAAAVHPASFGRTPGRHRRPARGTHPDRGTGPSPGGPVDQRPGRRTPGVRRQARRPAEPDGPLRRPRLRRPRPGVPVLDRTRQGCDLAAAEAGDPSLGPGPGARLGPRRRQGSGRMTAPRCILEAGR